MFDPTQQNQSLEAKITAGLERLSQVFRVLLWEKAKSYGLSPIQIQLLIFIRYHSPGLATVSYLAKEFGLTKPTISDAVKALLQKKLIEKTAAADNRSYSIALTQSGANLVASIEDYTNPVQNLLSQTDTNKEALWQSIIALIHGLNRSGIIDVQRSCYNCKHYVSGDNYCGLLKAALAGKDLRLDCPEFTAV